jgi:hypothetical protein
MVGIVVGETASATTGNAVIAISGIASCTFDASGVVAGHYVINSTATAGDCADGGATKPVTTQTFGRALATVASGAANVDLYIENLSQLLSSVNTWTAPQKTTTETPTISTATFTPLFNTTASAAQNHRIVLVHASCPCTLANPASLGAGQSGVFEIVQSATGSDTIGTWGSEYEYAGGTSTITLSTGASAVDYIPYYVDSTASFIVLGGIIKGPAH